MLLLNDSVMPETKTVTFGTEPQHLVYFCCCVYKKKISFLTRNYMCKNKYNEIKMFYVKYQQNSADVFR